MAVTINSSELYIADTIAGTYHNVVKVSSSVHEKGVINSICVNIIRGTVPRYNFQKQNPPPLFNSGSATDIPLIAKTGVIAAASKRTLRVDLGVSSGLSHRKLHRD